jgi:uncharacterized membrane protein
MVLPAIIQAIAVRSTLLAERTADYFRGAVMRPLAPTRTAVEIARVVNEKGRLYSLDVARFLAMVMMIQGHVLDALVRPEALDITQFPWNIWHAVRGLTAPIFLMVSGAVHAFATKRYDDGTVRDDVLAKRLRWALTIMGIGYLLVFPANRMWDLPFVPDHAWPAFTAVNILQLTGATLIMFVLLAATTRSVSQLGRRAIIMAGFLLAAAPLARALPWEHHLPLWVAAYLTPHTGSLFPILPFSAYLFVGVGIGAYLARIPAAVRDRHVERYAWPVGVVVVAVAMLMQYVLYSNGIAWSDLESSTSAVLALRRMGIVLVVFSGAALLMRFLPRWRDAATSLSSLSLHIYVVHLVLLFGTPWVSSIGRTHYRQFDVVQGMAIAVSVIAATVALVVAYRRLQSLPLTPTAIVVVKGALVALMCYLLLV